MKTPNAAMSRALGHKRRLRKWSNTHFGGMEAVKLHPLAMCAFRPDEGGTVQTALNTKLAPVSGYMRSNAYVEVTQVFVPYQAIEQMSSPTTADAGVTEMTRRRLMEANGVGLGGENEITKAANIAPRSIGGVKKVNVAGKLAYNCAVNHLRKAAYFNAVQVDKTNTAILPAILAANVLQRYNGVLDPETLVDGAINLTGDIPVKGIARIYQNSVQIETGETSYTAPVYSRKYRLDTANTDQDFHVKVDDNGAPVITADLGGANELTLRDMVKSQKLDRLVRDFAGMIKADPQKGEEKVERALYSLQCDYDATCQVLYQQTFELTAAHQRPTDGASINDVSAHFELNTSFATLVPRSELGGVAVTLVAIKPVETMVAQPDPVLTENWQVVNIIQDETMLDEQILKRSDLESDLAAADEDTQVFWVGHNQLKHDYHTQGANAQQIAGVEMKSSMWTYEIPTSVTPENVSYPADGISMYPFFNWNGAHAEYTISQQALISTGLAKGPNPVEKIALFDDDPSLVNG